MCSSSIGTILADPGDDKIDVIGVEGMVVAEMRADLVDQLPFVMVDRAASVAHHVEMIVGMRDLPSCRAIDPEM